MKNVLVLCWLCTSIGAFAAEVFVNGVNVDGLTNHTFEKVNVRLDEKGNVQIEAPGYSVKKVTINEQPAASPQGVMTQKYFLVTEQNPLGMTEYEIDLFLNGKHLRTLKNGEEQLVTEITKQLKYGKNSLIVQAKKRYSDLMVPRSTSKAHVFRVIIGEGTTNRDQVSIDKQVVIFARTAADTVDTTQEFTFNTR